MSHTSTHLRHMQVHHRSLYMGMAQLFFYGNNIYSLFQQMGGKAVPKGVHTSIFSDACFLHGQPEGLLNGTMAQGLALLTTIE